jgi:hypothetical protein
MATGRVHQARGHPTARAGAAAARTNPAVGPIGPEPVAPSAADVAGELSAWAVGGGIVTAALFPLAIPILALTAVAALLLVPIALAGGLAAALLALSVLAARGLGRRVSAGRRSRRAAAHRPHSGLQAASRAPGV